MKACTYILQIIMQAYEHMHSSCMKACACIPNGICMKGDAVKEEEGKGKKYDIANERREGEEKGGDHDTW